MSHKISYAETPHPLTAMTNGKLGMWLFLASEIMLFASLFSALLLLRVGTETWPHGHQLLAVKLASFNTGVLLLSGLTMWWSRRALKKKDWPRHQLQLAATIMLAIVFLILKNFEYKFKIQHGNFPSTNNFYGIYFLLTGLHALHILAGVIFNGYLLFFGAELWHRHPLRLSARVECAWLYWNFVDVVWVIIFAALYLS